MCVCRVMVVLKLVVRLDMKSWVFFLGVVILLRFMVEVGV